MLRGPRAWSIGALAMTALAAATTLVAQSHAQGLPSVRGALGGITSGVGGAIGGVGGAIGNSTGAVGDAAGGIGSPNNAGPGAGNIVGSTGRVLIRGGEGAGNGNNSYGAAGNTRGIGKATGVVQRGGRVFLTGPGGALSEHAGAPRRAARQAVRQAVPADISGSVARAGQKSSPRSAADARTAPPILASLSTAVPFDQLGAIAQTLTREISAPLPAAVGNLLVPDIAFVDNAGWLGATVIATGDPAWAQLRRTAGQTAAQLAAQGFMPSSEMIAFVESAACWRQVNFVTLPLDRINPASFCPAEPSGYRVASLGAPSESRDLIKSDGLIARLVRLDVPSAPVPTLHFPTVDRGAKGNRVVVAPATSPLSAGPRVEPSPAPSFQSPPSPGQDRLALRVQPAPSERAGTRDTIESPRESMREERREEVGAPQPGEPGAGSGGEARGGGSALRVPPIVPGLRGRETPILRLEPPSGSVREALGSPALGDDAQSAPRRVPGASGDFRSALRISPQPGEGARITAPVPGREQSGGGSRSDVAGPSAGDGIRSGPRRGDEKLSGERVRPIDRDQALVLRETHPELGGERVLEQQRNRQGPPAQADVPIRPAGRAMRSDDTRLALQGDTERETPRITRPEIAGETQSQEERAATAPPASAGPPQQIATPPTRTDTPSIRADESPRVAVVPQLTLPPLASERTIEEPRSDAFGPAFAALSPRIDVPKVKQGEPIVAMPPPLDLFDPNALRTTPSALDPWRFDELLASHPRVPADPELKSSIFDPAPSSGDEGVTIVSKGQVTGPGQHPKSPADMLALTDETRPAAQKCMAEAVYFEARGESISGQIAVAQVVLNRALSGHYPRDICGVVYQNSDRFLACQFTFACDGIPDTIREPDAYSRAERIARDMLDGRLWIEDVGKATHYHANWVAPWWKRLMNSIIEIGVHIFYRPLNWGDGSDAPGWGNRGPAVPQN